MREPFNLPFDRWKIRLDGAPGTLYAGEIFHLQFRFPDTYPMEAPEVIFLDEPPLNQHVYSNGHICLSILYDQWSPALTTTAICLSIQSMLSSSQVRTAPADNDFYVAGNRGSPKRTLWTYHGIINVSLIESADFLNYFRRMLSQLIL